MTQMFGFQQQDKIAQVLAAITGGAGAAGAGSQQSAQDQKSTLATLSGDKFKDLFYSICDSHRDEVFRFFHDSSLVVWDGTRYTGGGDIKAFWKALPSTSHDVKSLDAQPISVIQITELKGSSSQSMLVTATGTVKYGVQPQQYTFHHSFVLERDLTISRDRGEFYYIVSMTVRTAKAKAKSGGKGGRGGGAFAFSDSGEATGGYAESAETGSSRGRGRGRGRRGRGGDGGGPLSR